MPLLNVQLLLDGLLIGAIFALAAYGFALVWGVMNVINIAQGEFVIIGGYVALETFYGKIKFSKAGNNIAKPMALRQIQDGKLHVVAPSNVAAKMIVHPRMMAKYGYRFPDSVDSSRISSNWSAPVHWAGAVDSWVYVTGNA